MATGSTPVVAARRPNDAEMGENTALANGAEVANEVKCETTFAPMCGERVKEMPFNAASELKRF